MRRVAIGLAVAALVLAGCADTGEGSGKFNHHLDDGRTVVCIGNNGEGISCDWDHAK